MSTETFRHVQTPMSLTSLLLPLLFHVKNSTETSVVPSGKCYVETFFNRTGNG